MTDSPVPTNPRLSLLQQLLSTPASPLSTSPSSPALSQDGSETHNPFSLMTIEALCPSTSTSTSPQPRARPSPFSQRLAAARLADHRTPLEQHPHLQSDSNSESELPYLDYATYLPSSSPPHSPAFHRPPPPSPQLTKPLKLRKNPPPSHVHRCRTSGGVKAKERAGYGGEKGRGKGKEEGRKVRFGAGGAGKRLSLLACLRNERRETTEAEKGWGDGWGDEGEKEEEDKKATVAARPSKRRTLIWPSSSYTPSSTSDLAFARVRRRLNQAKHHSLSSASGGSTDRSFIFVPSGGIEVYRDVREEESDEEENIATPTWASSQPLSDAEETGENVTRQRRPAYLSQPRYPLQPVVSSPPPPTVPTTKHFRLPTLPSPPLNGGPAIHMPTPAGLTDVSFDFGSSYSCDEGSRSSGASKGTFVELREEEGGLFASPSLEQTEKGVEEGFAAFKLAEETQEAEVEVQHGGDASAEWYSELLDAYNHDEGEEDEEKEEETKDDDADAASIASSSDAPLGQKYPRRLPLLTTFPSFPPSQLAQHRPSPSLPFPTPYSPFNPFFHPLPASLPTSPFYPVFHPLAPSIAGRSTATSIRPPPLLDLDALPPSPAWLTSHSPSGSQPASPRGAALPKGKQLISHVKGKEVPEKMGGMDPQRRWRDAERKRAATMETKGTKGEA